MCASAAAQNLLIQQILNVLAESAFLPHQHFIHGVYGDSSLLGEGLLLVADGGPNLDDGAEALAGVYLLEEQLHLALMANDNWYTTCKREANHSR